MKGFSPRNLKYMRSFAVAWPDKEIVQRVVAQLPWRSNIALLDKLENPEERLWYAMETVKHGWSQPVLCLHIDRQTRERKGRAINNFSSALPPVNSDMAKDVFDDVLRHPDDRPSIGLLLVRRKNRLIAEYALSGYAKPMGVAQWETKITRSLPAELKLSLPTIKEIEEELSRDIFKANNKKITANKKGVK